MIAFISSFSVVVGLKSFVEKLMFSALVYSALRNKDNVAASFGNGKFELVAAGTAPRKLP
jgi:hypothetical protein